MTESGPTVLADLRIPDNYQESHAISESSTDAYFFERYLHQRQEMRSILDAGGLRGLSDVVDFGGHVGGWAWVMAESCTRVTVLDVDQHVLRLGTEFVRANGLDRIKFVEISTESLAALPPSDGILCVGRSRS